ncbi:MAG: DUF4911 domain-containing protein [Synergistaceae bacterium]|nr:DUF4911 domain-containing protein [Synergistaceae bacterium]
MAGLVRFALKAPKEEICYMSWTIDAYEGVAFLQNEGEDGVVSIFCPPEYSAETERIIASFESEGITIERYGSFQTGDRGNELV